MLRVPSDTVSPTEHGSGLRLWRILVPVAIVAAGAIFYAGMVAIKSPTDRLDRVHRGPLVETIAAPKISTNVIVKGYGTVRPTEEIDIVPQVPGVVVWKSSNLESGGFFEVGDLLAQIDPRDYQLAVEVAQAEVAQNQYALEVVRGEAAVARQEWDLMQSGQVNYSPLALHIPQLKAAEARLQASKARAQEARLRLERTEFYAPFNGRVRWTNLDQGQFAVVGQPVARIYSIETAEVVVPLADENLQWIDLPANSRKNLTAKSSGKVMARSTEEVPAIQEAGIVLPEAEIIGHYSGQLSKWWGVVRRTEGELDRRSRLANVVIEVSDPFSNQSSPLLVGMFVDVEIRGRAIDGVRNVPRNALRDENHIWVAAVDSTLRMQSVKVIHRRGDEVLVYADLEADERVVVSALHGVTEGMRIRIADKVLR